MSRISVAAGIILKRSDSGRYHVLLAKRDSKKHQGGLWEFPGGKIEPCESSSDALIRELKEELDISVERHRFYEELSFNYVDKKVHLIFFLVETFSGKEVGVEEQEICWVEIKKLLEYPFPKANQPIVDKLLSDNFFT